MNIKEFLGLTYFTSKLDQFLAAYDKSHPKLSASQRKEVEKYARINQLRDHASQPHHENIFWDKF